MQYIRKTSQEEHEQLLDEMQQFMEPVYVGIFWYNFLDDELLYPEGKPATEIGWPKFRTYPKLHQDIWKKLHFKAVAKKMLIQLLIKNIIIPKFQEEEFLSKI